MSTIAVPRVDPWDAREDRKIYLVWLGLMPLLRGWMLILTTQVLLIQSERLRCTKGSEAVPGRAAPGLAPSGLGAPLVT
jgi:hypothetical protein